MTSCPYGVGLCNKPTLDPPAPCLGCQRDAVMLDIALLLSERGRLHEIIAQARALIDPEEHPGWEEAAMAELQTCAKTEEERDRLRAALARAASALECDECKGSGCHVVQDDDFDPQTEACPLRDAVLADPEGQAALAEWRALEECASALAMVVQHQDETRDDGGCSWCSMEESADGKGWDHSPECQPVAAIAKLAGRH